MASALDKLREHTAALEAVVKAAQEIERVGSRERITGASLEQQYRDALEAGDEREAARLEHREAGRAYRAAQRRQGRAGGWMWENGPPDWRKEQG